MRQRRGDWSGHSISRGRYRVRAHRICELPPELLDLSLYRIRTGLLGRKIDPDNPPYTVRELIGSFRTNQQTGRKKVIGITRHLPDDPLPCLLYYAYAGYPLHQEIAWQMIAVVCAGDVHAVGHIIRNFAGK